ncbi:MAG: DUF3333 domain-containing protein, partial [bacterium]
MSTQRQIVENSLVKRYAREKRFQIYGRIAVLTGVLFLGFLLLTTLGNAYKALHQTYIALDIELTSDHFNADFSEESLKKASYGSIIKETLKQKFPEVTKRRERKALYGLVSSGAQYDLRESVLENPEMVGKTSRIWVLADDEVDVFMKGRI